MINILANSIYETIPSVVALISLVFVLLFLYKHFRDCWLLSLRVKNLNKKLRNKKHKYTDEDVKKIIINIEELNEIKRMFNNKKNIIFMVVFGSITLIMIVIQIIVEVV